MKNQRLKQKLEQVEKERDKYKMEWIMKESGNEKKKNMSGQFPPN